MKQRIAIIIYIMLNYLPLSAQSELILHNTQGIVEIGTVYSTVWQNVNTDVLLDVGSIIITGFASGAVINAEQTYITIGALSKVVISDIRAAITNEGTIKRRIVLELVTGIIHAEVMSELGGDTELVVVSNYAVCTARNTIFSFDKKNIVVERGRTLYHGVDGRRFFVDANF